MLILLKVVVRLIVFLSSAHLICRSTDISKCFIESLGVRDNEGRLYFCFRSTIDISWAIMKFLWLMFHCVNDFS